MFPPNDEVFNQSSGASLNGLSFCDTRQTNVEATNLAIESAIVDEPGKFDYSGYTVREFV